MKRIIKPFRPLEQDDDIRRGFFRIGANVFPAAIASLLHNDATGFYTIPPLRANYTPDAASIIAAAHARWNPMTDYYNFIGRDRLTQAQAGAKAGVHPHTIRAHWQPQFIRRGWLGLLPCSRAPHSRRRHKRPQWLFDRVIQLRATYRHNAEVIADIIRRERQHIGGFIVSAATIARILRQIKRMNDGFLYGAPAKSGNGHNAERLAQRRAKPLMADAIGYFQLDTKHMVIGAEDYKIFGMRDVFTRAIYLAAARQATAATAWDALLRLMERAGYPVLAIQTDNGPEFMGEFERQVAAANITQWLIPPYSPSVNGQIEGAWKYFKMYFRAAMGALSSPPRLAVLQAALDRFCGDYNAKPNLALATICADTGRRILYTPDEVRALSQAGEEIVLL